MSSGFIKTATPGIYKRQRVDGKFTYFVAYRDPGTHRQTWSPAQKSLGDAKAFKREIEEQRLRKRRSPDKKLLFGDAWKRYTKEREGDLAPSTLAGYESIFNAWFKDRYKRTLLVDINEDEVRRLKEHLAKVISPKTGRKLAIRRQRNILTCLGIFLSWAKTRHLVWTNPVADLGRGSKPKVAKRDAKRHVYLTHEEADAFLDAVRLIRDTAYPLFFTALHTGARLGELLSLRIDSVDLSRNEIQIERSVYKGIEKDPKDVEPRTVGISAPLRKVLKEYLSNGYLNRVNNPKRLLFPSTRGLGGYIDPDNLRRQVFVPAKWACLDSIPEEKIRLLRIHDLRHTFASWLIQSGSVDLPTIMELMGHSDYSTVLIYAHLDRNRAAAAGAAALSKAATKTSATPRSKSSAKNGTASKATRS